MPVQKRLLFLGGAPFQLPPILYAKEQGHYIITCDYLPNNPGHRYADEYYNVSTTDQEAVFKLAAALGIHGVVAYGSDPAAATAAYITERLGLPGNPYESVCILTQKDRYRAFLRGHGFHTPFSAAFEELEEAEAFFNRMEQPLMIKPVDSSGSKGVFLVDHVTALRKYFPEALQFSRVKKVILEQYVQRKGYQIAGDGFVVDGELVFRCFAQEHFIAGGNPFAPIGESYPLLLPEAVQTRIHAEIQRLVSLLHLRNGALNFDIMVSEGDEIYLMEVGPRGGGNLIAEMIRLSTGTHLIKWVVDSALGLDCSSLSMYKKADYRALYVLNASHNGIFSGIKTASLLRENIVEEKLFITPGEPVQAYMNSSGTLGCLILRFDTADDMLFKMDAMPRFVQVMVEDNG